MSTAPARDPTHTALLVMDCQPAILAFVPEGKDRNALLGRVEGAIADVRANGGTIAHVRVGFTDADWDAIPPSNKSFAPLAQHLRHAPRGPCHCHPRAPGSQEQRIRTPGQAGGELTPEA